MIISSDIPKFIYRGDDQTSTRSEAYRDDVPFYALSIQSSTGYAKT